MASLGWNPHNNRQCLGTFWYPPENDLNAKEIETILTSLDSKQICLLCLPLSFIVSLKKVFKLKKLGCQNGNKGWAFGAFANVLQNT
jgi:hypothetical protein